MDPFPLPTCPECGKRTVAEGHSTCFACHLQGIGFSFVGGGGYSRRAFHDWTTAERKRELIGENPPPNIQRV